MPAGFTTSGAVVVNTGAGIATAASFFSTVVGAPTISSFTPTVGGAGTTVTITGTNLDDDAASSIISSLTVGGVAVTSFSVNSSTSVTFTVPNGVTTAGLISVTTYAGTISSGSSFALNFYYRGIGAITNPTSWGQSSNAYDGNNPASMSQANSNFFIYGAVSTLLYTDWALSSSSTLTIGNGVTATTLTVPSPYTLTTGSSTTLNGLSTLDIASGGTVTNSSASALVIKGSLLIDGTFNHTSSSTPAISGSGFIKVGTVAGSGLGLFVNSSPTAALGTLTGTFTINGTYQYASNASATLPTATWGAYGSIYVSSVTSTVPTFTSKTFYNFTWDCSGQTSAIALTASGLTINGSMTVKSTGSSTLSLGSSTFGIGGNYSQTGGSVINSTSASTTTVGGNVTISGSSTFNLASSGTGTLSVGGNFSATSGTITTTTGATSVISYTASATHTYTGGATFTGTIGSTIGSNAVLNIGAATYYVGGALVNNGAIIGTGVVNLQGSAVQSISGTGSISNLTLVNSLGANITSGNQSITGILSISNGNQRTYPEINFCFKYGNC